MEVAALRGLRLGSASHGASQAPASFSSSSSASSSASSRRSASRAASPPPEGDVDAYRRHRTSRSTRKHTMSSERLSTGSSRSSASSAGSARRHSSSGGSDGALNLPLGHEFLPLPHDQDEEEAGATGSGAHEQGDEVAARDQVRHDVLCMLFDLPRATVFYQDFSCAIAASLAMHGRMYPTSSHVCFYSNVFGRERKILIPYESISELAKTTTMVFQNAIRIRMTDGQEDYTFASFWGNNRDNCFDLIAKTRERVLRELRPTVAQSFKRVTGGSPTAQTFNTEGGDAESIAAPTSPVSSAGPPFSGEREDVATSAAEEASGAMTEEETQPATKETPTAESADTTIDEHEDTADKDETSEETTRPTRQLQRSVVSDVERIAPKDISMTRILEETFPVSVDEFMAAFFLDNAPFGMGKYGELTGATEITINPWMTPLEEEASFGMTRSQQFRVPVEAPIGPKSSRVDVLQCLKEERKVRVVETSTRLADIPYGDYFSVEDRWTIVPHSDDPNACQVTIELKVVFGKSTFWKSTIESRAIGDNKEKWKKWVVMAKKFLEDRKKKASPAGDEEKTSASNDQQTADAARSESAAEKLPRRQSSGHSVQGDAAPSSSRRRSGRSMSVSQDRHRSGPHHRSSSRTRASGVVSMRSRNVHVKVFPWILVLVLLFIVVRLQSTLSTIESSLELTSQRVLQMQQQLAQLQSAACPAQQFIQ